MEVNEKDVNKRIDKYLCEITDYTRSTIQKMIENNLIKVNGKIVKNSYKLVLGDKIEILGEIKEESTLEPENIKLDIIYEDDDLIVINKPSGLVVHPGNGNKNHTLVNALLYYNKELSTNDENRPGIVHRLDKDTSGLMIVAKNNKAHQLLAEGFKNKTITRKYLALVVGEIKENEGVIDAPIGRDPDDRKKFIITQNNSKSAISNFKVIKRYKGYTLIELKLLTGRTHQIRVHMKYIGHPVYNDPVYSNSTSDFGQFLHSYKLSFTHPITNKLLEFVIELPHEFQDFIDTLTEI